MDPQTALVLARMLQGQTGTTPSPDLLAQYYTSNDPSTSLDDALSAARSYLANQGQGIGPTPAPSVPSPDTAAPSPSGGAGGNPGIGTTGFGPAANVGQAVAQAQQGPVGASLGTLGTGLLNSALNTTLTGSLTATNPLTGLLTAITNQLGKYGAQSEGIPGLDIEGLGIGPVSEFGLLGDPIASQFIAPAMASTLAALGISSAQGRGPSFGIEGISFSGGRGQGAAGGGGLTGVEGVPGAINTPGPLDAISPNIDLDPGQATGPASGPGPAGAPAGDTSGGTAGVGGTSGTGAAYHAGGVVQGPGRTVAATLEPGEFVVNKASATKHRGALARINAEKGLHRPIESLDDLLTRARAYFDIGGAAGPGMPSSRGPR